MAPADTRGAVPARGSRDFRCPLSERPFRQTGRVLDLNDVTIAELPIDELALLVLEDLKDQWNARNYWLLRANSGGRPAARIGTCRRRSRGLVAQPWLDRTRLERHR